MTPLTPEFVESCPQENGFRMRGLEMTRLEVFVDAAFAFAVTMLVISFDAIPTTFEEVMLAIKSIPAFALAVIQLVWLWQTHNVWSRRYGLDTTYTVVLSVALLIVMLIYIYPMRIMMAGLLRWMTDGYLASDFIFQTYDELRYMLVFLFLSVICLCIIFVLMYRYTANLKAPLQLNELELHITRTYQYLWTSAAVVGVLPILLAFLLPETYIPLSGFAFCLIAIAFPMIRNYRMKSRPKFN